jgi:hypothetical protein
MASVSALAELEGASFRPAAEPRRCFVIGLVAHSTHG